MSTKQGARLSRKDRKGNAKLSPLDERDSRDKSGVSSLIVQSEICVTTLQGIKAAVNAQVRRIELCSALSEGGLTPSYALIQEAVRLCKDKVRVHVLIRPRAGDFLYDEFELKMMLDDIEMVGKLGAQGVVIGALKADGSINENFVKKAVEKARKANMKVTFHRAFDMCSDMKAAAYKLSELGVRFILTSGGEATAYEGMEKLAELNALPDLRLQFIAASGINSDNILEITEKTGVLQVHYSAKDVVKSQMTYTNPKVHMGLPGADEYSNPCTSEEEIKAIEDKLNDSFFDDLRSRLSKFLPDASAVQNSNANPLMDMANFIHAVGKLSSELRKEKGEPKPMN